LGTNVGLNVELAITRDREFDITNAGRHGLRIRAVARVREQPGLGVALVVSEMIAELGLHASLKARFDQLLDQSVLAVELYLAGVDHRVQLIESARGLQRLHTRTLLASTFLTVKLLVHHGH